MFSVVRLHAYSSGRALALRIILECVLRTADLRVVAGPPLFHFLFLVRVEMDCTVGTKMGHGTNEHPTKTTMVGTDWSGNFLSPARARARVRREV